MRVAVADAGQACGVLVRRLPDPGPPGAGEVRVRMLYAPVNPADLLAVEGRYAGFGDRPEVLGAEGVGLIEAVGAGVSSELEGMRVIPLGRGNWTSHRLLDAKDFVAVPDWLDDRQAAVLRINPATAFLLLEALALRAGDALVHNASRSSVVRWVRILAAHAGIGTCRDEDAGDATMDGALDAVAGSSTGELAAKLRAGGRIIVYGHLSGQACSIPSGLMTGQGLAIHGFSLRRAEAGRGSAATAAFYARLAEVMRAHPEPIERIVPLSTLPDALDAARLRGRGGRVLLSLQD